MKVLPGIVLCIICAAVLWQTQAVKATGTWQYQRYGLNGALVETVSVPVGWGEPKAFPGYAQTESAVEDGTSGHGFMVIVGTDLDATDPTEAKIRCIASDGVMVKHNISDTE